MYGSVLERLGFYSSRGYLGYHPICYCNFSKRKFNAAIMSTFSIANSNLHSNISYVIVQILCY